MSAVAGFSSAAHLTQMDRVRRTVALVQRRGYALAPARLGDLCVGGRLAEGEVRWAVAACPELEIVGGLVVDRSAMDRVDAISSRAQAHPVESMPYVEMARSFTATLVALAPFVRSVSIAGSLASGGFRASDDVDLNLIVDDGHRHLAYVVVNVAGLVHALAHRSKPVDALSRRPVPPRPMAANLILERSQCFPLRRQDEDMAFELMTAEPVFGADEVEDVVAANPALAELFPQLEARRAPLLIEAPPRRLPAALFPSAFDGAARRLGEAAWRYMQWTRRRTPEALARVAYVRETMRPYTLFDRPVAD